MEARVTHKKLTRRERLNKCNVPDDQIPTEFLDEGLTFDIMEEAGEVDGRILDLVAVKKWQHEQITVAMKKSPPPTTEEIHQFSQINAFSRNPFNTYIFLKEIDQKIEAWVCEQESIHELMQKIERQKKTREDDIKKLNELEPFIEQKINSLELKLHATLDEGKAEKLIKKIASLLHEKEKLPEKKNKIVLGPRYYNDPNIINLKIDKLCTKLKCQSLTDEERNIVARKLQYWTNRLEAWHGRAGFMLGARPNHLGSFGLFGLANILRLPRIAGATVLPIDGDDAEDKNQIPRLGKNHED